MSRAELLRRHAYECEARARSFADRATLKTAEEARQLVQQSDVEAICARVFAELAQLEDEAGE